MADRDPALATVHRKLRVFVCRGAHSPGSPSGEEAAQLDVVHRVIEVVPHGEGDEAPHTPRPAKMRTAASVGERLGALGDDNLEALPCSITITSAAAHPPTHPPPPPPPPPPLPLPARQFLSVDVDPGMDYSPPAWIAPYIERELERDEREASSRPQHARQPRDPKPACTPLPPPLRPPCALAATEGALAPRSPSPPLPPVHTRLAPRRRSASALSPRGAPRSPSGTATHEPRPPAGSRRGLARRRPHRHFGQTDNRRRAGQRGPRGAPQAQADMLSAGMWHSMCAHKPPRFREQHVCRIARARRQNCDKRDPDARARRRGVEIHDRFTYKLRFVRRTVWCVGWTRPPQGREERAESAKS